jgi:LysR family glycine cleavage system transcriptional activator
MYNYSYKKNKLDQLKGFCAVVECGTIVEAAKKLHLSESSISLQISSLEQDLKVKLFDKIGRNLKVNKAGRAYY